MGSIPHGVSNNISDIAIRKDDVLFSYENLPVDNLHSHEEMTDFEAMFIGSPDIEAGYHGMATWGELDIKVAANVDGILSLYLVNAETGDEESLGALSFTGGFGAAASANIESRASIELIEFGAMDTVQLGVINGGVIGATQSTKNAGYGFAESQADFAALLFMVGADSEALPETSKNGLTADWAAIALIDEETRQVDYIVELKVPNLVVQGIALRRIVLIPAQVPTLSEWGLITTAFLLLAGAVFFLRRSGLSMYS